MAQWKFELLMKPPTTQGHLFKAHTTRVGWAMYP